MNNKLKDTLIATTFALTICGGIGSYLYWGLQPVPDSFWKRREQSKKMSYQYREFLDNAMILLEQGIEYRPEPAVTMDLGMFAGALVDDPESIKRKEVADSLFKEFEQSHPGLDIEVTRCQTRGFADHGVINITDETTHATTARIFKVVGDRYDFD
jgi:hypothetical protein